MDHYTFNSLVSAHRVFFDDKAKTFQNWDPKMNPGQSFLALCFSYTRLPKKVQCSNE